MMCKHSAMESCFIHQHFMHSDLPFLLSQESTDAKRNGKISINVFHEIKKGRKKMVYSGCLRISKACQLVWMK